MHVGRQTFSSEAMARAPIFALARFVGPRPPAGRLAVPSSRLISGAFSKTCGKTPKDVSACTSACSAEEDSRDGGDRRWRSPSWAPARERRCSRTLRSRQRRRGRRERRRLRGASSRGAHAYAVRRRLGRIGARGPASRAGASLLWVDAYRPAAARRRGRRRSRRARARLARRVARAHRRRARGSGRPEERDRTGRGRTRREAGSVATKKKPRTGAEDRVLRRAPPLLRKRSSTTSRRSRSSL